MLTERKWLAIGARLFTSNGTANGVVSVLDTRQFRVKQKVIIKANALPNLVLEVKKVTGPNTLEVGLPGDINQRTNLSAYTVALSSSIEAEEQVRSSIPDKEYERAVYAEEPIIAKRVILVDELGEYYSPTNPLPISVDEINIGEVLVKLTHTGPDPDSVQIGDGIRTLIFNPDGSLNARVTQVGTDAEVKNTWDEVNSVPTASQTDIVSYIAPALKKTFLQRVEASGENVATYEVTVNGTVQGRKRTYFGGDLSCEMTFEGSPSGNGLPLQPGDVVVLRVTHNRPDPGTFDGRIQALEVVI